MRRLDDVVAGTPFESAGFVKLDVQGFELEVLRGASRTLTMTGAVLVELNLIEVYEGAPLLHEVVHWMGERGFRVYDICSLIRRPLDDGLWQVDAMFLPDESPLVADTRWKA